VLVLCCGKWPCSMVDCLRCSNFVTLHYMMSSCGCVRCLLDQKAVPVMKIVRSIFSLILTFSSQLNSQSWQYDVNTGQLCHPSFSELQRTYSTFHEHSLFLFKGISHPVKSLSVDCGRVVIMVCVCISLITLYHLSLTQMIA